MDSLIKFVEGLPAVIQLALSLGLGVGGGGGVVGLALKKHRRALANLRRPIRLIGTSTTSLRDQWQLLQEVGLFDAGAPISGESAPDFVKAEHRLVILGYSPDAEFRKAFEAIRNRGIPILVYAAPRAIRDEDMDYITRYPRAAVCNSDIRLVSDVFAVMSTFPEKK